MALTPGVVGSYSDFNYVGYVQSIKLQKGIYKLEAWGSQGGNTQYWNGYGYGGAGGYAIGYIYVETEITLFICVGAQNGYNGGGSGNYQYASDCGGAPGGGCTHIAKISGTLREIGAGNISKVLMVAGGGGGAVAHQKSNKYNGGIGGGINGGNGNGTGNVGTGGTQSSGGKTNGWEITSGFGFGANGSFSGGGGGLYGGGAGTYFDKSAGGGSGYIGGVPAFSFGGKTYSPLMSSGVRNSNGLARITFFKKLVPTMYYGDKVVDALYYGDPDIDALYYGDRAVS